MVLLSAPAVPGSTPVRLPQRAVLAGGRSEAGSRRTRRVAPPPRPAVGHDVAAVAHDPGNSFLPSGVVPIGTSRARSRSTASNELSVTPDPGLGRLTTVVPVHNSETPLCA